MSIPIIFFHYGNPGYLKYSLKQAQYFNPTSTIYLLGDEENNGYPFVSHIMAQQYEKETSAFTRVYKHMSRNSEHYELNCFLRWFYIKAFCLEKNIGQFIYLDSDVLLFQDVSGMEPFFKGWSIANTGDAAGVPAFTYFKDYNAINNFCDYLLQAYTNQKALRELELFYQPPGSPVPTGDVSDMILFQFYFRDHPEETGKLDLINNELAVDVNIRQADGYETARGIKKIYWQGNIPYCKQMATGRLIRFASFHYQGDMKPLMVKHYKADGYAFRRFLELAGAGFKRRKRAVKKLFKKPSNG